MKLWNENLDEFLFFKEQVGGGGNCDILKSRGSKFCDTVWHRGGEGVEIPQKQRDILNGQPLMLKDADLHFIVTVNLNQLFYVNLLST